MTSIGNPEDAFDRLGVALGLTDNATDAAAQPPQDVPTAEWSADRNRLILTSPTRFEGSTQSYRARGQTGVDRPSRKRGFARQLALLHLTRF